MINIRKPLVIFVIFIGVSWSLIHFAELISIQNYVKQKFSQLRLSKEDDEYGFLYGPEFEKALNRAAQRPKKIILYWNPQSRLWKTLSRDSNLSRECGGCLVREDKHLINDSRTEAVIILYKDTGARKLPKRNLNHHWIWQCGEAPPFMSQANWVKMADKIGFNMTFTYRIHSDVSRSYEPVIPSTPLENPLKNKQYLALIAVSNCDHTPCAVTRMQYLKTLKRKGFPLSTIGRCFRNDSLPKGNGRKMIEFTSQHKFYFAFENSYHCKDYVTEKFFRAITAGVVPVVWGATKETYESYIPSSGFIFVEDFPSMQSFIDYIYYLNGNDTAYLEYFRWRKKRLHHPHYRKKKGVCQICRFLHGINVDDAYKVPYRDLQKNRSYISDRPTMKVVSSITKQWMEDDNPDCYRNDLKLDKNGRIV